MQLYASDNRPCIIQEKEQSFHTCPELNIDAKWIRKCGEKVSRIYNSKRTRCKSNWVTIPFFYQKTRTSIKVANLWSWSWISTWSDTIETTACICVWKKSKLFFWELTDNEKPILQCQCIDKRRDMKTVQQCRELQKMFSTLLLTMVSWKCSPDINGSKRHQKTISVSITAPAQVCVKVLIRCRYYFNRTNSWN